MDTPHLGAGERRRYERNITLYYAYQLGCSLALWSPIWVLYLQQMRGLSLTQITALDAPFWLIAILAEVPTGTVADRWGRRVSLLWGAASFAVALFFFGIAENYPLLLLAYLAWPVSMALQSGADSAFLYDSLAMLRREGEFRKLLGRSNALHSVGFMVGALIGAPLADATDLAFPILASAAIALLAVLAALAFREPRHQQETPSLPYLQTMGTALSYAYEHPSVRWMLGIRAVLMGAGLMAIIFTQPFLLAFDVPLSVFGLISAPLSILRIGGALVAYRLALRLGERNLIVGLALSMTAALLVIGIVPSLWAFSMFAVIAMGNAITGVITADFVNRHTPQALRATVLSVGQMAISLLLLATEPLMGFIADRSSVQVAFVFAGVAVGVLAAVVVLAWIAVSRAEGPEVAPAPEAVGSRQ